MHNKKSGCQVRNQDATELLKTIPDNSVDLAIVDPPYNIGYNGYGTYDDSLSEDSYLRWCLGWLTEIERVLAEHGSFWLIIGDERAAQLKLAITGHDMVREDAQIPAPLFWRSWCIHYFTFGVATTKNFARSHVHLLHFVKSPKKFYFDTKRIRVPSARQLVYNDKRGNPDGKLPDNVWVLSPLDLSKAFTEDEDVWLVPRVAGTFKNRVSRGTKEKRAIPQMPEAVLDRIILACSKPGDLVVDPMVGAGTTPASAVRLGRRFLGGDIDPECCRLTEQRVESINSGEDNV